MFEFWVTVDITFLVAYSIVAIIHITGLTLLCKASCSLPNQRLLVQNLAATELLFCLTMLTDSIVVLSETGDTALFDYFSGFFVTLCNIELRLSILHIIIDRFIEIYMNIKYPLYVTRKRILALVVFHWSISAVSAMIDVILVAVDVPHAYKQIGFYSFLALDLTILISSLTTYIYFFKKVRRIRRVEDNGRGQLPESVLNLLIKKFKQPCYIVITYICFNLSSTLIYISSYHAQEPGQFRILYVSSTVLTLVGFISDAAIYVFANRNVRTLLRRIGSKRSSQVSQRTSEIKFVNTNDHNLSTYSEAKN